jgi:hypothetical protein
LILAQLENIGNGCQKTTGLLLFHLPGLFIETTEVLRTEAASLPKSSRVEKIRPKNQE